jgi:hypothetical protein
MSGDTCNFKYTAKSLTGAVLGSGLSPLKDRELGVTYTAPDSGAYGIGFQIGPVGSETFTLIEVYNEVPQWKQIEYVNRVNLSGNDLFYITKKALVLQTDASDTETWNLIASGKVCSGE